MDIPDHLISRFRELIHAEMGLYFPENHRERLERRIRAVARDMAQTFQIRDDPVMCIHRLLSSPLSEKTYDILTRRLTIGETCFFRDKALFETLKDHILPELIASHREKGRVLRFWSAGCCTGEEPYSLAILIDQVLPEWPKWEISILGTDINAEFLRKAEQGIYTKRSFRNTPDQIINNYFRPGSKGQSEICPDLKKMVHYVRLNLAKDNGLPINSGKFQKLTENMDLILCRNVLLYFSPESRLTTLARFVRSLSEKGWLVVSPSETGFIRHANLRFIPFPETILYRKT